MSPHRSDYITLHLKDHKSLRVLFGSVSQKCLSVSESVTRSPIELTARNHFHHKCQLSTDQGIKYNTVSAHPNVGEHHHHLNHDMMISAYLHVGRHRS